MLDGDVAFFDIDVGRAVLAHGAELDQVAIGLELPDREQQIQRAHHIVDLGEDGVFAVDHRIRRRALFGKMDHRVRLERLRWWKQKIVVGHVPDKELDGLAGELLPGLQPRPEAAGSA